MRPLDQGGVEYHSRCSRSFFGVFPPPKLDVTLEAIREFAAIEVLNRITLTGVQKKLSLGVEGAGLDRRFTIVALWGRFVLKPPAAEYANLPENEDAVMRLAALSLIPVVPHAMIRLASGELAYICRRIDRTEKGEKLAMEDLCQVSQRLTEDKYRGSAERTGKLIARYSVYPGFDAADFFERMIFCYLTGNADMHLKNYSLLESPQGMRLSPAYDLLSTTLALPGDAEESALTINGKKQKIAKKDFDSLAGTLEIPRKSLEKTYRRYSGLFPDYVSLIRQTLLPDAMKDMLAALIEKRAKALFSI
jgi:serine/threonine-protein kinase HipA